MAEQGIDAECNFSNIRKTYRRSATWNSRSAPASPIGGPTPAASTSKEDCRAPPFLERQGSRARSSRPPLQPLAIARRSLQEWPKPAVDDTEISDCTAPATPGRRRVKTGPDIKLDLESVHRMPLEPTDIELKRDKFAFFDKECSRVADYHIYLGSDAVAKNKETLKAHGITHVLNCVGFVCPEYFNKDFVYKTLWLQDSPGEDITSLLYDVFDYFEEVGELGGRVFVHCCQGVSRSTSLVIAYMMWRECRSFEEAFQVVKASRGVTNPNMGFACQLLQCQRRVHAAPMSPSSLLRMYRLAPHSSYDPLHLVPKALDNPGAGALDSRGAFVIHVPLAIYVWIGRDCDPNIAQAARVAAAQVVRYERAQGPTHMIAEGFENDEFWESLGKYAHLVDDMCPLESSKNSVEFFEQRKKEGQEQLYSVRNSGAGNRRVPSYSADFELYQRVRQGGVVPPVPSTGAGMVDVPTRIPAREDRWSMLRRKFLSGELFPAKEMDASDLSQSPSVASSSPLFSPFSITTTSSASTGDSVSASPISQLSIVSPGISSLDLPGPCSESTSHHYSLPFGGEQKLFPFKSLPLDFGSKIPAVLLAKRRGTSAVKLCGLEDIRSSVLSALVTEESNMSKQIQGNDVDVTFDGFNGVDTAGPDLEMHDTNVEENVGDIYVFAEDAEARDTDSVPAKSVAAPDDGEENKRNKYVFAEDGEAQDTDSVHAKSVAAVDNSGLFIASTLEVRAAVLYAWPQLERVDSFTADHLSSKGVFVLLAPQQSWNGANNVVYVWVGSELDDAHAGVGDEPWQPIGRQFLQQVNCRTCTLIRVIKQGYEPAEFWENFVR